ncbi:uncharacterized protein APUU_12343A [Aspergillus puulaauensis]|uniref:NAD-dependent epimerase/dehydratase domain-containing protein n=1 Tax=Aspergillus puulaauensis TaxID=1220207 RepID=A0A7R7XDX8_9EURO|nr:uncharacterized protein APUU_12343A [Aspergillus puulaauensis]BCS19515.1 hypothetical protein APUU_12343A [Aspergillus puulaauensis]
MQQSYVLVTGATGLIGAHVVDKLLQSGTRVRIVVRSKEKADVFLASRREHSDKLDVVFIQDLTDPGAFDSAVQDVTGVIHLASPLRYDCEDNEQALIIPAIQGVRSILRASLNSQVKRVVLTSSFGSVMDLSRPEEAPWKYTSDDWNPITYAEATSPHASAREAYRGSKTLAEQEAWKLMSEENPRFDLVTLCPSMVFGPLARSPRSLDDLNESNKMLWNVASGSVSEELPPCQFNFWIDVRNLADIHIQALRTPAAGGKRYIPVAREPFTYQIASGIMQGKLPYLQGKIPTGMQAIKRHIEVDQGPIVRDFPGIEYTPFKETVSDFVGQFGPFLKDRT